MNFGTETQIERFSDQNRVSGLKYQSPGFFRFFYPSGEKRKTGRVPVIGHYSNGFSEKKRSIQLRVCLKNTALSA
jgi:hypothetical protein